MRKKENQEIPDRPTPRKVLVVSGYFPPHSVGGAEVVALRHAKLVRELGWDVAVFAGDFSCGRKNNGAVARGDTEGLPVFRARVKVNSKYAFLNPSAERPFARVLREFSPDVVHFHNPYGLGFNLIERAEDFGAKIIVTLHDRWAFCFKATLLRNDHSLCGDFDQCALCAPTIPTPDGLLPPRLRRDYAMAQISRAHVLISPSQGIADDFLRAGADPAKMVIQSSGIDLQGIRARLRQPGETTIFQCSAHLGNHKGILVLAEALKILWSDRDLRGKWRFVIAGDGPLSALLRDKLNHENMQEAVELTGAIAREKVLARLVDADVVVLPSLCPENQPVSLLEGLASGAALIASNVGGNVELVQNGANGLLYERDRPEDLAAAMRTLILSPESLTLFSSENLRRREQYDENKIGGALDKLYRSGPFEETLRDRLVACGFARDRAAAAVDAADQSRGGRRIRLLWWRWRIASRRELPPLWISALGRMPLDWFRAMRRWGWAPFLQYIRTDDRGFANSLKWDGEDR